MFVAKEMQKRAFKDFIAAWNVRMALLLGPLLLYYERKSVAGYPDESSVKALQTQKITAKTIAKFRANVGIMFGTQE